jgi:hypothetical protein
LNVVLLVLSASFDSATAPARMGTTAPAPCIDLRQPLLRSANVRDRERRGCRKHRRDGEDEGEPPAKLADHSSFLSLEIRYHSKW